MRNHVPSTWLRAGLTLALVGTIWLVTASKAASISQSAVRQLPFSLEGSAEEGSVIGYGRWVRTTTDQRSSVPVLNAAQISCSRSAGTCLEAIAELHSDLDPLFRGATGGGFLLTVDTTEFKITEWSRSTIKALAQPRAADIELRLSLLDRAVVRTSIETGARGATGANTTPEVWTLK